MPVQKVRKDHKVKKVIPAPKVIPARPVKKAIRAIRVLPDRKARKVRRVIRAQEAILDRKDQKARKDRRAPRDRRVLKARKVPKVRGATKATRVILEFKDLQGVCLIRHWLRYSDGISCDRRMLTSYRLPGLTQLLLTERIFGSRTP